MKRMILAGILTLAAGACLVAQGQQAGRGQAPAAQPPAGQAPAAPAAPAGPQAKSPEEMKAVQAIVAAQNDPDGLIKAAEELLTKFADTQFKELALTMEAGAYEQKGDKVKAQITYERILEVNPKSIQGNLMVGELTVQQTGEKDLDREEKLAKGEKLLKITIDLLNTAPKPNPALPDEAWAQAKKSLDAQAHNDLGLVALVRAGANKDDAKKYYDAAISEFQTAASEDPSQPTYLARLASSYLSAGKPTDAIATCDKILADAQLNPQIRKFVEQVKAAATKAAQPAAK